MLKFHLSKSLFFSFGPQQKPDRTIICAGIIEGELTSQLVSI